MSEHRHRNIFPRRYRISRQEGFSRLLQEKPFFGRWFAIYIKPNDLGHARIGVTVGKRLVQKAVHRNKIKRKIREYFRNRSQTNHGSDVIVRLKRPIERSQQSLVFSELAEMLNAALARK